MLRYIDNTTRITNYKDAFLDVQIIPFPKNDFSIRESDRTVRIRELISRRYNHTPYPTDFGDGEDLIWNVYTLEPRKWRDIVTSCFSQSKDWYLIDGLYGIIFRRLRADDGSVQLIASYESTGRVETLTFTQQSGSTNDSILWPYFGNSPYLTIPFSAPVTPNSYLSYNVLAANVLDTILRWFHKIYYDNTSDLAITGTPLPSAWEPTSVVPTSSVYTDVAGTNTLPITRGMIKYIEKVYFKYDKRMIIDMNY